MVDTLHRAALSVEDAKGYSDHNYCEQADQQEGRASLL